MVTALLKNSVILIYDCIYLNSLILKPFDINKRLSVSLKYYQKHIISSSPHLNIQHD